MITLSEEDLVKLLDREYNRGKADGLKCSIKKEFTLPSNWECELPVEDDPDWLKSASTEQVNTYWTLKADSSM